MGTALINLFDAIIGIISFIVIANAIISWLVAFNVINLRNPTMGRIVRALDAATEPLLRPIRRFIPSLGGLDLSPIVLLILLKFFADIMHYALAAPLRSALG